MLLAARGGRRRWCRGAGCSRWWGDVEDLHADLPIIALTNINKGIVSLELYRRPVLGLKNNSPVSGFPYLITGRKPFLAASPEPRLP
jgi:hypothetical protein